MIKKKFKITDMHCSSCALTIDMNLEDLEGVKAAKTSYAKGETEIEFDPNKLDEQQILATIKKSGYSAVPLDS
ncbi:MAG: heavy-metal-associated domain-containing protein [Candidatus Daviesbacteria bacterium]|nr:MAG: heavy-metal-associated domain-containing protein [Candidatus Daviesbacteria bacterium]